MVFSFSHTRPFYRRRPKSPTVDIAACFPSFIPAISKSGLSVWGKANKNGAKIV
jgi:hypothetical protein